MLFFRFCLIGLVVGMTSAEDSGQEEESEEERDEERGNGGTKTSASQTRTWTASRLR